MSSQGEGVVQWRCGSHRGAALTQHSEGLLAPLVPGGQGRVVHGAGDHHVVVVPAGRERELADHRVGRLVRVGLHHVWTAW